LQKLLDLIGSHHLKDVTDYLASEVLKLAAAGAQFAFLAANTPHIVFEDVQRQSPIPLISIVRSACDQAIAIGAKRLGIFGTRFTMQGRFYPDVFSAAGMTIITPTQTEQTFIQEKYMNELVNGKFLPETRDEMLRIALRLSDEEDVAAVILAGTELPLLLRHSMEARARFLDTTPSCRGNCDRIALVNLLAGATGLDPAADIASASRCSDSPTNWLRRGHCRPFLVCFLKLARCQPRTSALIT
jgi:aspartate racemase